MPIIKGTSSTKKPKPVPKPPEGQAGRAGKSTGASTYDAPDKSGTSLAAPRGAKVTKGMTPGKEQDLVTASKGGRVTSGPFKTTGGGGKGDGGGTASKPGPWESGTKVGKWAQGATGKWERAGNTYGGSSTGGGGGGGTRPRLGGALRDPNLVGSGGRISYSDGEEYSTGSDNTTEDGFGGGGGGGTGNPLAGVSSALKSTSIKGSKIEGMSVEEAVKGAKRTRKTGAKRTQ